MELGYARVSTAKQDLDRQIDALRQVGIAAERIYVDKKSGATTERPGLTAALAYNPFAIGIGLDEDTAAALKQLTDTISTPEAVDY